MYRVKYLIFLVFFSYLAFAGGDYDFNKLDEARVAVKNCDFLPVQIRDTFETFAKAYDRLRIKNIVDTDQGLTLVKDVINSSFSEASKQRLALHIEDFAKLELGKYQPYFQRIEEEIRQRGRYATNLFDGFFFHLYGVGQIYKGMYSEQESKRLFGSYDRKKVDELIKNLKEIGFLKESSDFSYNSEDELRKLLKRKDPSQVSTLIIAGGHSGIEGVKSISRYGDDSITLDLSPLVAPDVIVDINDSDFLKLLTEYFEGKLSLIEDTSNVSDGAIFKPETLEILAKLLRTNGQLILSTNQSKNVGYVEEKTAVYLKTLGLVPVKEFEILPTGEKVVRGIFQKSDS